MHHARSPFRPQPATGYATPHETIGSWTVVPVPAGRSWGVSCYVHRSGTSHGNHGVYRTGFVDQAAAQVAGRELVAEVERRAGSNPRTHRQ